MRKFYWIGFFLLLVLTNQSIAQNSFSFSCSKDTTINGCALTCITLKAKIPDIRSSTSDYVINPLSGPGGCYAPYVSPETPGTPSNLTVDDTYTAAIPLPFPFPFYDDAASPYSSMIISTNGFLSFDVSEAGNFAHWSMTPGNVPSVDYDRSLVMGVFHDLDPRPSIGTSPNQRIKYEVVGTAPHRKMIVSTYKVPLFSTACNALIENTHQMVLYEGLGIIEVFVTSVQPCPGWNSGRKMIGLQNFNRNKAIMAPGRTATGPAWGSVNMNESWRFVPAVGPTLYRSVELYDLAGTLIATGDTTSIGNNTFEVAFPNVCPTGTTTYVVKSKYEQINSPGNFVFGTDTITVIAANPLSASAITTNATCATLGIGSATVTVTGGTGPYEYSADGGTTWQSSNVFNLPPGTYTITYREVGNTCEATTTVTIGADPNLVTGTFAITNVACNGGNTGSIVITASNGSGVYEYSSNGGTSFQSSNTFPNLPAGSYTIRIRDNAGCFRDTVINITEPTALVTSATTANATCSVTANGNITVTANGGTTGYEYNLDNTGFQSSNVFSVFEGAHTVIIRDANGCTSTVNVTVALTNDLFLQTRTDTTICFGASIALTTNSNAASYTWSGGTGLSSTTAASPVATPTALGANTYTVSGTLGQCTKTDQVRINVESQVNVSAGGDIFVISGEQAQLVGTVTGASTYLWTSNPVDANFNANILNPIVKPAVTTNYTLTATNAIGCTASDNVLVTVIPYCIKVKNAFSPNGDGINDIWQVYDQFDCLKNIRVSVFNRYGSKVFESSDYRNDWDGRYKGKPVPDGTYYAVIEFKLISGKTFTTKTDLTVIR